MSICQPRHKIVAALLDDLHYVSEHQPALYLCYVQEVVDCIAIPSATCAEDYAFNVAIMIYPRMRVA